MLTQDGERETEIAEPEPQRAEVPEPKHGAGVRVLRHYLQQGSPDPNVVANVMTDFPHDRHDMMQLLHHTVGNAFVQSVIAAMQRETQPAETPAAPEQPATQAPVAEAAPVAEPTPAPMPEAPMPEAPTPEVAKPSAAAEAATQVSEPTTPIVAPSHDPAKTKNPYKDKKWASERGFEQLDDQQRRMIDELRPGEGALVWDHLPALRRAGFLNVTAVMKANGFSLNGLSLLPLEDGDKSGIQQDRLLFTSETAGLLKPPLDAAIAEREQRGDRGFIEDKPEDGLHPGMGQWGGRQWVTRFSMQVGGGSGGGFVDIDEFGPKVDVVGTLGHAFEVLRNKIGHKKTDPFTVARGLHKRGDEP